MEDGRTLPIEAALVREPGATFEMATLRLDAPRADEVLVRIVGVGLCHTDVVAQMGLFGYGGAAVFGHEGAGIVEQVGSDVRSFGPGDRVAISFRHCGSCEQCRQGLPSYCASMPQLNYAGARTDGSTSLRYEEQPVASNFFGQSSFATHALTYERNLVPIPDDFPLEIAGPLGCGIQTGAGATMRSMACKPGSAIVIAGGGAVGLSAVMGALVRGCETIALIEPHAERRALALELGATHVVAPEDSEPLVDTLAALRPAGFDYAFDTTGNSEVIRALARALGPRGLLGLVGVAPPGARLPIEINKLITYGHRVMGIIEGDSDPASFIPELIALHRQGRLPFDRLIRTYPLSQINEAVRDQHEGRCIKAVLLPGRE